MGINAEVNYIVDYEAVNYHESNPTLVYSGFRTVKQKPFLISSDFLEVAIDNEKKSFLNDYPQHVSLVTHKNT